MTGKPPTQRDFDGATGRNRTVDHILTKDALEQTEIQKPIKLGCFFPAKLRESHILTKDALYLLSYSSKLATRIGLEPTTSSVTG